MKSHLLSQSLKVICKVVDKESNEYSCIYYYILLLIIYYAYSFKGIKSSSK